ncbi:MAG TPA: hypothetical protein PKL85_12415 [Bacteroidia bacterium]|nr:hypothetical protein [Bacteroidia bacterium]
MIADRDTGSFGILTAAKDLGDPSQRLQVINSFLTQAIPNIRHIRITGQEKF